MADFRKLFLVLAVLAVATAPAFGQAPFSCVANTVTNAQLRAGGITEMTGDIVLQCANGPVAGSVNTSFAVQIQGGATAVTNHLDGAATPSGFPISALLTVTDVFNNPIANGTFHGFLQPNAQTVVVFPDVTLPTGTTEFVRISNIRVAAQQVANVTTTIPVYSTVSTTPTNIVSASSPLLQTGTVYPSLQMSLTDCAGGTFSAGSFTQCVPQPSGNAGDLNFAIKFQEQTVTSAFRTQIDENTDGEATNATRLLVTFTNVPAGAKVLVTDREIGGFAGTSNFSSATFVKGADANGSGGTLGATAVEPATCGGTAVMSNPVPTTAAAVNLVAANVSGSVVYAVWQVTAEQLTKIDTLVFGVQISFEANPSAGSPALTTSTTAPGITGTFAPVSTVVVADDTSAIPRFQDLGLTAGPIFAISPCVTNLLFPYVTNQQGYETGIALVNTSTDNSTGSTGSPANAPFNTSSQTGTCAMYFFGDNMPTAPFVTPEIGSAATDNKFLYTNTVGAIAPNFSGYVIARCNFQYAHGLAYILTPGGSASQYLALVIPDQAGVRPPNPFSVAPKGSGEQLGF